MQRTWSTAGCGQQEKVSKMLKAFHMASGRLEVPFPKIKKRIRVEVSEDLKVKNAN